MPMEAMGEMEGTTSCPEGGRKAGVWCLPLEECNLWMTPAVEAGACLPDKEVTSCAAIRSSRETSQASTISPPPLLLLLLLPASHFTPRHQKRSSPNSSPSSRRHHRKSQVPFLDTFTISAHHVPLLLSRIAWAAGCQTPSSVSHQFSPLDTFISFSCLSAFRPDASWLPVHRPKCPGLPFTEVFCPSTFHQSKAFPGAPIFEPLVHTIAGLFQIPSCPSPPSSPIYPEPVSVDLLIIVRLSELCLPHHHLKPVFLIFASLTTWTASSLYPFSSMNPLFPRHCVPWTMTPCLEFRENMLTFI